MTLADFVPSIVEVLDTLGIAVCVLDDQDRAICWNSTFMMLFPEHAGHMYRGEQYAENLRRFYRSRLNDAEAQHIEQYIADGIARHRRQDRPFEFRHRGLWLRVTVLPVPGVGRMRIWSRIDATPDADTVAQTLAHYGQMSSLGPIADIPDGLMMCDSQGRIVFVNRQFLRIYGIDSEAHALGRTFPALLAMLWSGHEGAEAVMHSVADKHNFIGAPFELPLPGDRRVRLIEHRGVDGSIVSTHVDVTETYRLHRETEAARARAEALTVSLREQIEERQRTEAILHRLRRVEAIGQLSSGMAHDFNNLLAIMLGALDNADLDQAITPFLRGRLDVIRDAVERGATLVNQLLAFARRQPLLPQPVALADMIDGMLPLLRSACGRMVTVEVDLPATLPRLRVDPTQLELVILNLVINARDAMPEGGPVRVSARVGTLEAQAEPDSPTPGQYVVLTIGDRGVGMTEEVRANAFEPFFTTKPVGQGSGLGLSHAYGIIRQSGGTIQIESTPGQGSAVHLYLPCSGIEGEPETPRPAPDRSAAELLSLVVVDDEPDVRDGMESMLRHLGYRVHGFGDPLRVQQAIRDGLRIDALVSDMRMPGLTGAELARWVWERHPALPVVFVTGFADAKAFDDMPYPFRVLRKPFRLQHLKAAVAEALGEVGHPA